MLDFDLAELYEVETRALKQAVRRNMERFPEDFMFTLHMEEVNQMVSQNVIPSKSYFGGAMPFAFTEHGVAMISGVLRSDKATQVNIAIFRAFIALRRYALQYTDLSAKTTDLEQWTQRELSDIREVLRCLSDENQNRIAEIDALDTALDMLFDRFPQIPPPNEPRIPIGFKKD